MIADSRVGILRGGSLLLFIIGLLLTSTGCSRGPAPDASASSSSNSNVDQWIRFLATGDPPRRAEAVTELGKLQKYEYVEYILKAAVNDRQIPVRVAAIEALAQPGLLRDKEMRSVVLLLSGGDSEVRMAACRALSVIKPPDAAEALLRCIHDRDSSVRLAAVESLAKLGPSVVPMFESIFATGSSDQKSMVAAVTGKTKSPAYVSILTSGLKDDDDDVRRACAEALGLIGQTSAVPPLVTLMADPLSSARLDEFKQRLLQRPRESDYALMIKILDDDCVKQRRRPPDDRHQWIRQGNASTTSAAAAVYRRALDIQQRDAARFVRSSALQAITNIAPANLDSVLVGLLALPDEDASDLASQALRVRGDTARQLLIQTAQDSKLTPLTRVRAVDVLSPKVVVAKVNETDKLRMFLLDNYKPETGEESQQTGSPTIVELAPAIRQLFLSLLADPDAQVRAAAASHLGEAGAKEAIEPLLEIFRRGDPSQMDRVTTALACFKDDRIAPVLIAALDDKRYAINHVTIVKALGAIGDKRATATLVRAAVDRDDPAIQMQAIDSLGFINDPLAIPPMLALMTKLDANLKEMSKRKPTAGEAEAFRARMRAVGQLDEKLVQFFGVVRSREAVEPLVGRMADTNRNVDTDVLVSLGQIGDARAVGPISNYIATHGSYHMRLYVNHTTKAGLDALVAIGDPGGIEIMKRFATNWQDPKDPFTGKYAIEAMGRMKNPAAVAVLMQYLTDPAVDPSMKDACVGPALAVAGIIAKEPLLKTLKESPKPRENATTDPGMYAAQILAVMDKPEINVVPDLVRVLATKPPAYVVQRINESLAQTHHDSAVQALADVLKTADIGVRQSAALALGKSKLRSAIPHLQAALKDADAKVVECAASSLLEIILEKPDTNSIPDIVRILATKPPNLVVQRVTETLAQMRHESAVLALADMLRTADTPTRELAAIAMGRGKLPLALPHLRAALKDADAKVRGSAASSLLEILLERPDVDIIPDLVGIVAIGPSPDIVQRIAESLAKMHQEPAVRMLANMLKATDIPTRQFAAIALGKVKLRSAVPHLKDALNDTDAQVRESAAASLDVYGVVAAEKKKEK